jgi:hypothetical protein
MYRAKQPSSASPSQLKQVPCLHPCAPLLLLQKEQVQQLATASAAIPALTTSTEELRAALAAALGSSLQLTQVAEAAAAANGSNSNARCHVAATCSSPQHRSCGSPVCAHVRSCSPVVQHCCPAAGHCQHCTVPCCAGGSSTAVCLGATTAGGLLSSVLLPTAGNLRAKMDQLESNIRSVRLLAEMLTQLGTLLSHLQCLQNNKLPACMQCS